MRQSGRNKRLGHRAGAPVAGKIPDTVILHDRSHKVPGRGEGVNDSGNSAISDRRAEMTDVPREARAECATSRKYPRSPARAEFLRGIGWNPGQNVAFSPYIKGSRGHYDDGRARI